MVKKGGFKVDVVVNSASIKEYLPQNAVAESDPDLVLATDNADAYVESDLRTPISYMKIMHEKYVGGIEEVPWPVTPYSVKVTNESGTAAWWTLEVDGHHVKKILVKPGKVCTLDGFEEVDGIKEFVFSLPRFAETETDRIDKARESNIGTIRCLLKSATFTETRTRVRSEKSSTFHSANKKDANGVTKGKFTMATTQAGKTLRQKTVHASGPQQVSMWHQGNALADIRIKYRMGGKTECNQTFERKRCRCVCGDDDDEDDNDDDDDAIDDDDDDNDDVDMMMMVGRMMMMMMTMMMMMMMVMMMMTMIRMMMVDDDEDGDVGGEDKILDDEDDDDDVDNKSHYDDEGEDDEDTDNDDHADADKSHNDEGDEDDDNC